MKKTFVIERGAFYTDGKDKKINTSNNQIIQFYLQKSFDVLHQARINGEVIDVYKMKELLSLRSQAREAHTRAEQISFDTAPVTIEQCFERCIKTKTGRTLSSYKTTLGKIQDHFGENFTAENINEDWLNFATERKMIPQENYPFKFFKIETEGTVKRAMKTDDLKKKFAFIPSMDKESMALDVCRMIFFGIGINLKGLHDLDNFQNETLTYKRAKTGKL